MQRFSRRTIYQPNIQNLITLFYLKQGVLSGLCLFYLYCGKGSLFNSLSTPFPGTNKYYTKEIKWKSWMCLSAGPTSNLSITSQTQWSLARVVPLLLMLTLLFSSCAPDYLELFDGDSLSSPSLGKFCGDKFAPISSTQNILTLLFVTDDFDQFPGFLLNYTFSNTIVRKFVCYLLVFYNASAWVIVKSIFGKHNCLV